MRPSRAALPALAAASLVLAACSTPDYKAESVAQAPAAAPAPPAPPAPPVASRMSQRVEVTGSSVSAPHGYARAPLSVYPGPWVFQPPGADTFPEAQANKAILVEEQPVSTFSSDVDTASYAFVRRQLNAGRLPPAAAVRVEEMVNYFPYTYARPASRTQPFAVTTEVMPSPWKAGNQLLHIAVRGFDIEKAERPPMNVVLLVDVSGSMGPQDRLPLLKQSFRLFADGFRPQDRVAIVTYASGTAVALEPTTGQDKRKILDAIDALGAGGATAGSEGLQRAYAMAERHFDKGAVNRVILATDGDFNVGISDFESLKQLAAEKRKGGVSLTTLGFGTDNYNEQLMEQLADAGDGNYAYIDSLREARKVLVDQLSSTLKVVAKDVKLQVEFNPAQVSEYRLLGYENRALKREDFSNDKVDAGEIGAGHTVTALYEIVPVGGKGWLEPLRYQQAQKADGKSSELAWLRIRYKAPGSEQSKLLERPIAAGDVPALKDASEDLRFATAVAAFAQQLKGGQYTGSFSFADSAKLARGAKGEDRFGLRGEFVQLVELAQSLQNPTPSQARIE